MEIQFSGPESDTVSITTRYQGTYKSMVVAQKFSTLSWVECEFGSNTTLYISSSKERLSLSGKKWIKKFSPYRQKSKGDFLFYPWFWVKIETKKNGSPENVLILTSSHIIWLLTLKESQKLHAFWNLT